jgi:hypothetical protein
MTSHISDGCGHVLHAFAADGSFWIGRQGKQKE